MALQLHYYSLASPNLSIFRARSEFGYVCRDSVLGRVSGAHLRKDGGRNATSYTVGWRSCASAREDFEPVSMKTSPLCECSNLDSSDSRRTGLSEVWMKFFEDWRESFCIQLQGGWRKVLSAALLCSSALVAAPSLAAPVPVAVQALPSFDFVAAAVTLAGALGILQFFDELAKRNLLEKYDLVFNENVANAKSTVGRIIIRNGFSMTSRIFIPVVIGALPVYDYPIKLSRKLCHILSGLVFMLFWPLFSAAPAAKYLAACAPAANGVRMIGLGLGLWKNEALVKAISREGSQSELLQGPLYYAITITVATLFFWRNSPVGACAVATLCAGDGFADIVGRKWGRHKLPYNSSKSVLGSVAFFVMASLLSMGYVAYFSAFGFFAATQRMYLAAVGVALVSAIVESLPLPLDDNFTVSFTAIGMGMLFLPV